MNTSKKYNLTFVVIFFAGIYLLCNFLWWLAPLFIPPVLADVVALCVAIPLSIFWFVLSWFLATKIGEKTFDRWPDD